MNLLIGNNFEDFLKSMQNEQARAHGFKAPFPEADKNTDIKQFAASQYERAEAIVEATPSLRPLMGVAP